MSQEPEDVTTDYELPPQESRPPTTSSRGKVWRRLAYGTGIVGLLGLLFIAYRHHELIRDGVFKLFPFVIVVVPNLIAIFHVVFKDWNNYKPRWARYPLVLILAGFGLGGLYYQVVQSDGKAAADAKATAAQSAQADNTKQFLSKLESLSEQVSALRTSAATESLQRELAKVKGELQKTLAALSPPKAELIFTFSPFADSNNQPFKPINEVTLPFEPDGSVKVNFTMVNYTAVTAEDGIFTLFICELCKFAKEPVGFQRLSSELQRVFRFTRFLPKTAQKELTAEIIPPHRTGSFDIGVTYRCRTCTLDQSVQKGKIHLR